MKKRSIVSSLIFSLLLLSVISITTQPVRASSNFIITQVIWGTPSNPVSVGPNMGNQILTVILQYLGFSQITGIRSYIELPVGFTNTTGGNQTWAYVQSASPGSLITLQYTINVGNVSLGTYYTNLYVLYSSLTESYQIRLDVKGNVEFEARSTLLELTPGIINNVSLTLINKGSGNASAVTVSIIPPQQVGLISSQNLKLGNIPSRDSASFNVSLYIPASLSGTSVPLTLQMNYIDPYGYTRVSTQTVYFLVLLQQPVSLILNLSPYQITSGSKSTLMLSITNTGLTSVNYLTITLTSPQLTFINFDGKWYIGKLNPGNTKSINITIYTASSSSGAAQITASLSYVDSSGTSRTETRTLGIILLQPELTTFMISVTPQQLISGKDNVLTLNLTNTGNVTMYSTTLTFTPPSQIIFRGFDGKLYIGDLNPKESITINLTTYITSSSTGVIQIPIAISYIDSSGVSRSESRVLGFTLLTSTRAFNIHLSIEPQKLIGGISNELLLTVTNVGSDLLRNISITINPSSQIALIGFDGKWYVGTLKINENKSLKFTVYPNPAQSTYLAQINAVINYIDPSGASISESTQLSIIIIPNIGITNPSISIDKRTFKAGSVNNLTLTIINNNVYTMRSVTLVISFSGDSIPTMLTPNNIFIDSIRAKSEVSVPVSVYIPASSGDTMNMVVTVNYYNEEGTLIQYSQSLGLLVLSPSDLRMTNYVILPQPVILGQPFSITLTLTNLGIGPAYNVYASVMHNKYFTSITGNQVYIGNIQSGSSSTITFSFMSTNVTIPITDTTTRTRIPPFISSGNFTVTIALTYQDNLRYTHTLDIMLPIKVSTSIVSRTQTTGASQSILELNFTNLAVIGVIILVVIIITLVIRGRRKNEIK